MQYIDNARVVCSDDYINYIGCGGKLPYKITIASRKLTAWDSSLH